MSNIQLNTHISGRYNQELQDLTHSVLTMGGEVEQQLHHTLLALKERDPALAEKVVFNDLKINNMEVQIDEECMRIIAKRHPTASDLRLVMTVSKAITDIERIGDEIERVARTIAKQHIPDSGQIHSSMLLIGEHVSEMLRGSLDAFARMDVNSALLVYKQDEQIDLDYKGLIQQIAAAMQKHSEQVTDWLDVLWAVRAFERVGDRCKNLCEYIVYLTQGADARYATMETLQQKLQ